MQQNPKKTRFQNIYSIGKMKIQEAREFTLKKFRWPEPIYFSIFLNGRISSSQNLSQHYINLSLNLFLSWALCVSGVWRGERENGKGYYRPGEPRGEGEKRKGNEKKERGRKESVVCERNGEESRSFQKKGREREERVRVGHVSPCGWLGEDKVLLENRN
jgi:hypothetical protein